MAIFSQSLSALSVHTNGTIGTFKVSQGGGKHAGVDVRYLLTHVTLSDSAVQSGLLEMLAPVREVFDLAQLGFDEIMQRDIDDARVSLELIPYLLDSTASGQIKLFPPIVAVVLPLAPNSRTPTEFYKRVVHSEVPSADHTGLIERRLKAGDAGNEQFEFFQFVRGGIALPSDGARLSLSPHNCALAIVDGQHRAMALLALQRNLRGGWNDARRSPYESYYKIWTDQQIRGYDLTELQLPILICAFPELDGSVDKGVDVVKAARKVFLTLNKSAKRVSDSRNKLLNDQDIVAECLRETLSVVKAHDARAESSFRIWNVELDQEGDRVKVGSEVAFTGVSHLYHIVEHLLMSPRVSGIGAVGKSNFKRKRLDDAYSRLRLKEEISADKRAANSRFNYSDDVSEDFRKRWGEAYVPIIDHFFSAVAPFESFSLATLSLRQDLIVKRDKELEKMLFDGQATARTMENFADGLRRRIVEQEEGWATPEIETVADYAEGVLTNRSKRIDEMREDRAVNLFSQISVQGRARLLSDGKISEPLREAVDKIYENVFTTVAFQTALVCTYVELCADFIGDERETKLRQEYVSRLNDFLRPKNQAGVLRLVQVFEGQLQLETGQLTGGATFRNVVLSGELQPSEWPKFRYVLLELWTSDDADTRQKLERELAICRKQVAQALCRRRIRDFCAERGIAEDAMREQDKSEILRLAKASYEEFLAALCGQKKTLDPSMFQSVAPQNSDGSGDDDQSSS